MFHDPVVVVAVTRARARPNRRTGCSRVGREKPRGRAVSAARKENRKNEKKGKEATREKGAKRGQQAAARLDLRVRAHKTNNKIWNTGRRPHVPVIFQGRREDVPTYGGDARRRKRDRPSTCDWSGKRNFSGRATVIGERDSRRGSRERCATAHAGGPLRDSLGVPLGTAGPWNSFV